MTHGADSKRKKPAADIEFSVTESCGLLEFLLLRLNDRSRNNVKSLLTHREVIVDGRIVTRYDHPLKAGQVVRIVRSVNRDAKQSEQLQILYEDQDLIVIDKPAGLLSIATDNEKEKTAYFMLTDYIRRSNPGGRIYVVHRLDRETSGVLMFAKNEKIKLALQNNWDTLVSRRGYVAVVEGQLEEKRGRVSMWLKQTTTLMMYAGKKAGDGVEAVTNYQVMNESADYSLVNIQLETGRKNQIRVLMKELGHPVAGDHKYGAKTNPLKRLALHAYQLALTHPFSNQPMCFETEIPKRFKALLKRDPAGDRR